MTVLFMLLKLLVVSLRIHVPTALAQTKQTPTDLAEAADLVLSTATYTAEAIAAPVFPADVAPWMRRLRGSSHELARRVAERQAQLHPGNASALHDANVSATLHELARIEQTSKALREIARRQTEAMNAAIAHSERLIGQAWEGVRRAPFPGPAGGAGRQSGFKNGALASLRELGSSVPRVEWYIFAGAMALIIALDVFVLQHLPEVERTHVGLLLLWLGIALGFCAEVWVRLGEAEGISWASGYILEFVFSIKSLFMFMLIFQVLQIPRRLMRKALLVSTIGSALLRVVFQLGLAEAMCRLTFLSYVVGAWLIYCGSQHVVAAGQKSAESCDVTQSVAVRALRKCLGDRLGDFYDEDGEAVFLQSGRQTCMTLLGVAIASFLITDFLFGADATLVKMDIIPNPYVRLTSSILALFTLRALYFVVKDLFTIMSLAKYCLGLILFVIGAEMLVARFTQVSGVTSLIIIANVIMLMTAVSAFRDCAGTRDASAESDFLQDSHTLLAFS